MHKTIKVLYINSMLQSSSLLVKRSSPTYMNVMSIGDPIMRDKNPAHTFLWYPFPCYFPIYT
jgi:hypothetical protein